MLKNFGSRLKSYLPENVFKQILEIISIADKHRKNIYIVGGTVRDFFLERNSLDIDLTVEGKALELTKWFTNENVKVIAHPRFGTLRLRYGDLIVDIASARREEYEKPGALPLVFPGNINDDMFRRDFTINAMAIQLNNSHFGKLIDPYHGTQDLHSKLIRIIHPYSFIEDATRIFRAIRYEQRLDFRLESHTEEILRRDIKMIDALSNDRIKHELYLFLNEDEPEKIMCRADELGILAKIHPALIGGNWLDEKFKTARKIINNKLLPLVYLCLLAYRLNRTELGEFIKHFNFTRSQIDSMTDSLTIKLKSHILENKQIKPMDIYRFLKPFSKSSIEVNFIATDSIQIKRNLELFLTRLKSVRTRITGKDIAAMGVTIGPQIGIILERLLEAKINGEIFSTSDEMKLAHKLITSGYVVK